MKPMAPMPGFIRVQARPRAAGFTLVEMIVVLAIIVVITAIVFSGESGFNRSFYLTNTAYDVALTFREAQTFGISSRAFGSTQNARYGIYVSNATPSSYVLFADVSGGGAPAACPTGTAGTPTARPGNCLYDGAGEQVTKYQFDSGFTVSGFCVDTSCYTAADDPNRTLSVVFTRPNQDATITTVSGGSAISGSSGCLTLSDATGAEHRYVRVNGPGQISVVSSCP
jgi:prepilin-type N-terminal cleavage/methylation domain-containing protein